MAEHTPGPWRAEKHPQHDHDRCSELWTIIAGEPDDCCDAEIAQVIAYEAEANARLIAAAPDLLAKLTEVRKWMDADLMGPWDKKFCAEIDALIARVEGK